MIIKRRNVNHTLACNLPLNILWFSVLSYHVDSNALEYFMNFYLISMEIFSSILDPNATSQKKGSLKMKIVITIHLDFSNYLSLVYIGLRRFLYWC